MAKKLIKLTEGDLHRIIKESVNRVLTEGKTVNNKPYFSRTYGNEKAKPGEYADSSKYQSVVDFMRDEGYDKRNPQIYAKHLKNIEGAEKHNARANEKYNQRSNFEPMFGDEYEVMLTKQKQKDRKRFARMLRYNRISLEEFKNSSEEEQKYFWERFYWYEYDCMMDERRERAYWNNLIDMRYGG